MREPSESESHIEIPSQPKMSGSPRPPRSVVLPIICEQIRSPMFGYGLFALLSAAFGLLLIWAVLYQGSSVDFAVLLPMGGFVLIYFGAIGITLLIDALRPGPSLLIDIDGLEDRRQKLRISWDQILEARLRPSRVGIAHIALRTRTGFRRRGAPFRVGAGPRGRGDDIVIPLQFLKPPPHVTALTISALLERSGVAVRGKPWWAERGFS